MISEPKVLLLHWNSGKWHARDRPQQALTENSCEAWIFAFDGDFLNTTLAQPSDLHGYDIIIANSDPIHLEHLCKLSSSRPASSKWVTLIEGDTLDYIKPRPFIRELFDNSDLVNCINPYTESFFKKFTTAPVQFLGFPYPIEGIRALSTPMAERRREIFLAPMLLGRWLEYFCMKDIGLPLYGYEKKLSRKWRNIFKYRSFDRQYFHAKVRSLYNDSSLKILREVPLSEFFQHTGGSYLWCNLDPRYTWGRYILDAAALQVPIIATRSTGHMEKFFPKTMVETEFELEKALSLAHRLLSDKDFYNDVATVPIEYFDEFRHENKKKELMNALF